MAKTEKQYSCDTHGKYFLFRSLVYSLVCSIYLAVPITCPIRWPCYKNNSHLANHSEWTFIVCTFTHSISIQRQHYNQTIWLLSFWFGHLISFYLLQLLFSFSSVAFVFVCVCVCAVWIEIGMYGCCHDILESIKSHGIEAIQTPKKWNR